MMIGGPCRSSPVPRDRDVGLCIQGAPIDNLDKADLTQRICLMGRHDRCNRRGRARDQNLVRDIGNNERLKTGNGICLNHKTGLIVPAIPANDRTISVQPKRLIDQGASLAINVIARHRDTLRGIQYLDSTTLRRRKTDPVPRNTHWARQHRRQ